MDSSSITPLYGLEPFQSGTIQVAGRPLPLAQKVAKKSLEEFCQEAAKQRGIPHFKFTENIHLTQELRQQIASRFQIPEKGISADPAVINSLVICDSGKLNIGKMLYTNSPFNKGKPFFIYSGEVRTRGLKIIDNRDDYEFNVKQSDLKIPEGHSLFMTAKEIGGFAGFMQDLVDPIDGFTREGSVALVNLIGLPIILHGIGNVLFIAAKPIGAKEQLGIPYGAPYWKTFADRKIQKVFMNDQGERIAGMLLEEKLKKIKLLKAILKQNTNPFEIKKAAAILLAVVPREIIEALSDEEQTKLHQLAPTGDDIPKADDYSNCFEGYDGYDCTYFTAKYIQDGLKSPLSALSHLKEFKPSSRQPADQKEMESRHEEVRAKGLSFFNGKKYPEAINAWLLASHMHLKLYSHCGVIYYGQKPIPLHGASVKFYWNIGNAYLKSEQYLEAFENLRLAHQVQQYLDTMALRDKTLKDMEERLQTAFNQLRDMYIKTTGKEIKKK